MDLIECLSIYICLLIYLSIYPTIYISACINFYIYNHLFRKVNMFIDYGSNRVSIYLYLSSYPPIYISFFYISIYPFSIYLSILLSVYHFKTASMYIDIGSNRVSIYLQYLTLYMYTYLSIHLSLYFYLYKCLYI